MCVWYMIDRRTDKTIKNSINYYETKNGIKVDG